MIPSVSRFSHQAMGTIFEVAIAGCEESYAGQASQAVFSEIDRIERLFSRFNPCSEIGQVNRLKPGDSMKIGLETYECLKIATDVGRDTGNAFDINVGSLLKYKKEHALSPDKLPLNQASPSLELWPTKSGFVLRIGKSPITELTAIELDLGGIGKGFALDKGLEVLAGWSIENALVHAGTSTALAIGTAPDSGEGRGWPVAVGGRWDCFRAPQRILLRERAVSGSGTEVKGAHIYDPRTGEVAQGHLAAWASHASAAVADALSTAFMVMSTEEVEEYCRRHPEVWAMAVIAPKECRVFNRNIFEA
jgi:thiamine biosynthesis lipoprotein